MPQERTMIQVDSLSKSYGAKLAVDDITFSVRSGEVLGFLGPNGAGKSTTMKILTCFMAPSRGQARVGGKDVVEEPLAVREMLGYLPEDTPLYHDLTSLEFLEFTAALRRIPPAGREKRIREICEVCGLFEVLAQPVGELSRGYRQRLGLAQAMIHDPPILILDEPTSGLDPNQIVEIRQLIKRIGKEKTVILSTHILPEVQATCGRVIIIHEGRLVADGSPDELVHRDAGNSYRVLLDAGRGTSEDVASRIRGLSGVTKVIETPGEDGATAWLVNGEGEKDLRRELFALARDAGWVLLEMQRRSLSLEEVFRKLTR